MGRGIRLNDIKKLRCLKRCPRVRFHRHRRALCKSPLICVDCACHNTDLPGSRRMLDHVTTLVRNSRSDCGARLDSEQLLAPHSKRQNDLRNDWTCAANRTRRREGAVQGDPSNLWTRRPPARSSHVDVPGSRHLGSIRYTPHMPHRCRTGCVLSVLASKIQTWSHMAAASRARRYCPGSSRIVVPSRLPLGEEIHEFGVNLLRMRPR
jgi:hypothetical protein